MNINYKLIIKYSILKQILLINFLFKPQIYFIRPWYLILKIVFIFTKI